MLLLSGDITRLLFNQFRTECRSGAMEVSVLYRFGIGVIQLAAESRFLLFCFFSLFVADLFKKSELHHYETMARRCR